MRLCTNGSGVPVLAVWMAVAGCARSAHPPESPSTNCPTITRGSGFRAGFGRADLTTPPGPGTLGYGPEAKATRGWRQRLHARAIALEDERGERIVIVVADLDFISGALHREVVRRVQECGGPGADRVVVSSTHTHSAPGHYSMHAAYDEQGSSVAGFDPAILAFFADNIARAALDALASLRPAIARWGQAPVWGVTRVRSIDAHIADPHGLPSSYTPPDTLPFAQQHVDPTLLMLRIDTVADDAVHPAGAFSIFAVHGTAMPAPNDLVDADLFARAQRLLEEHIDRSNGFARGFRPRAVHVLGNGPEGDVLPLRDSVVSCDPPLLRPALRPGFFRSPPGHEIWRDRPGADPHVCIEYGIEKSVELGNRLGEAAIELFDALGDSAATAGPIARNFTMARLRGPGAIEGICPEAKPGTAALGGAETGRTRILGWKIGGFLSLGAESGTPGSPSGCHGTKRTLPSVLQRLVVGEHPFEEAAQFTVLRIGPALIGTVPFEATTTVGLRMRAVLRAASERSTDPPSRFAILGLASGYLGYVTTQREYDLQFYEGGSTLYGPGSAVAYTRQLGLLVRALADAEWDSPAIDSIPRFPTFARGSREIMPRETTVHPSLRIRPIESLSCTERGVVLRWIDGPPGALFPAKGQVIGVEQLQNGRWTEILWDDDFAIEVRVIRHVRNGALWEARWRPTFLDNTFRFVLHARDGVDRVESDSFTRGPQCQN